VSDAAWLTDLGAHGLVKASFVPPAPVRELRDLTRTRTVITRERAREVQRLEKLLEDTGINCPQWPPTSPAPQGARC
jgi:transposase